MAPFGLQSQASRLMILLGFRQIFPKADLSQRLTWSDFKPLNVHLQQARSTSTVLSILERLVFLTVKNLEIVVDISQN